MKRMMMMIKKPVLISQMRNLNELCWHGSMRSRVNILDWTIVFLAVVKL